MKAFIYMLFSRSLLLMVVLLLCTIDGQGSQRFTMVNSVVDGGGATFSTSGRFKLGGSVTPPVPGALTSKRFSLQTGFWISDQPLLFRPLVIGQTFNFLFQSTPGTLYILQSLSSTAGAAWQSISAPTLGDGTVGGFTVPIIDSSTFYRILEVVP
jgi:hypothetical protein